MMASRLAKYTRQRGCIDVLEQNRALTGTCTAPDAGFGTETLAPHACQPAAARPVCTRGEYLCEQSLTGRARTRIQRKSPAPLFIDKMPNNFAHAQNFSYTLEELGRYYRAYVELMTHFDLVLPGRVHRVVYEAMIDNTEAEVRRLLEYCGLPFDERCLRFYKNARAVRTAGSLAAPPHGNSALQEQNRAPC